MRALRVSRGWDKSRMAAELRKAAAGIGEPVAEAGALVKMIRRWESGGHRVSERYRLLYKMVFGADWPAGADPRAVLDRARRAPGDDQIAAIGDPAVRAVLAGLKQQVKVLAGLLDDLLSEEPDE